MVFNDSRVFPARMYGVRVDTGARSSFCCSVGSHQAFGTR